MYWDLTFFLLSGFLFIDSYLSNRFYKTVLGYIALGLGYYFLWQR